MKHIVTAAFLVVAVIHLLPLSGALGARRLEALYGTPIADRNLEILMRHRAVLFGLLGAFFVVAAFVVELQLVAFVFGFVSVVSFLWVAWMVGGYNDSVRRVLIADVVALIALLVGVGAWVAQRAG